MYTLTIADKYGIIQEIECLTFIEALRQYALGHVSGRAVRISNSEQADYNHDGLTEDEAEQLDKIQSKLTQTQSR